MKPLISVIVAIYKVERYLTCCLESIIRQTYCNLEILLVVTPSDDRCEEICKEYEKKDSRINIILRPKLGLSDARNAGIVASNGEYLVFIDGDDYISDKYVERLYSLIEENNCDIAQCGFKYVEIHDTGVADTEPAEVNVYSNIEASANLLNQKNIANVVTWSKLYIRHLFDQISFPLGKLHEDQATTYLLLYTAKNIAVTSEPLYYYRQVPESITGQGFSLRNLDTREFMLECLNFYKDKEEQYLHARALCVYFRWVASAYHNLRVTIPNSKAIQKEIIHEARGHLPAAISDNNISIVEKGMCTVISYCPIITSMIIRLKQTFKKIKQS